MAELLETDRAREYRHARRPFTVYGAYRGSVRSMRRAPRACFRRRSATNRTTLLHELGSIEVYRQRPRERERGKTHPGVNLTVPFAQIRPEDRGGVTKQRVDG